MFLAVAILCMACCGFAPLVAADDKGYIFTAPRVLTQEALNDMQLALFGFDAIGEVTIRLLQTENDTVLAEKTITIEGDTSNVVIPFFVPSVERYEARLQIQGEFQTEDKYKIFGEDTVNFQTKETRLTFVQTDKPIYKISQIVKFRVLTVDKNLRPIDTIADIWVEDPSGYRMAQWNNVTLNGIVQREFPLSNEPPLGTWRIYTSINGSKQSSYFEVKEYVLPKFEVTIKTPPFVLVDAEMIPIEVCAKYTYGKQVEGGLNLNVSLESYTWAMNKFPIVEVYEKFNGCFKYEINVTEIDPEFQYSYRRIKISTSVTEKGTGVVRNETKYIDRTSSPLSLNFDFGYRQYIKPGLPFIGSIKVTKPDETPAPDEPLSVCAVITRERVLADWWASKKIKHCSNITSDSEGKLTFTLLPQSTDTVSVSLEAKSLTYTEKRPKDSNKPVLYQPMTSSFLRPWYSPSGTHIQIQSIGNDLPCGGVSKIQVLYTAKENANYRFHYMIVSRGKIYEQSYVDVEFKEEEAVTEYQGSTLNQQNIQILPKSDPTTEPEDGASSAETDDDNKCKAMKDAKYVPFVGSAYIEVDVSSLLSPSFYLIVYYIQKDREAIADSHQFKVQKCFDNNVSISFGDEAKQPGADTTLTVKASPKSACGIKVVDKSISLMDSSDQLTPEKVFQALEQMSGGQYYSRNHCNKKTQPGLNQQTSGRSVVMPPRPPVWSSSPYEDTITAFENMGFLVILDFIALTRPCKNSDGAYYDRPAAFGNGVRGGNDRPHHLTSKISGGYGTTAIASRRPVAAASLAAESSPSLKEGTSTESAVDVRDFFPETWLFEMDAVGEDGSLVRTETLPHTITEWVGSAVCLNSEDGLGLSDTATIKGMQDFFMSFTLPYSVIRNEKLPVIVTAFSYTDKCLPITVELEENEEFKLLSESSKVDICVCSGESQTYKFFVKPSVISTQNFTVTGRTADSSDVCGEQETSDATARDTVRNSLVVEPEGFPVTEVTNYLFCPEDSDDDTYEQEIKFVLPDDVVEGSARAYVSVSGDIMGPSIENLDNLVQLPTGCGEQNMVKFAPIVDILNYLSSVNKLTEKLKAKAKGYLLQGYQRQLRYRHSDGSYSAFGKSDKEGSMWLSAFVLRSFAEASKYIAIDNKNLEETTQWIVSKQNEDGCFPMVGSLLNSAMMGGVKGANTTAPLTAYVLTSLLIAGEKNETLTSLALSCIGKQEQPTPYQVSLFAYAAALAGNKDLATQYLDTLYNSANTTGGVTYFPSREHVKSVEIETAAYAILTNLELDSPLEKNLPIVRWLTQKRNSKGGFSSTQDTVTALKALSEFATHLGKDPVNLHIALSGSLTVNAQITEDDRLVVQKYKVPSVPSDSAIKATGTGCGLLQASLFYNTLQPKKLDYFNLNVETSPSPQDECKFSVIKVCASYVPEGKKSNMALIQVKMISGYVPLEESLKSLKGNNNLQLKRYEVENNEAIFYFDEIDNSGKCFEFTVERAIAVEDAKPGRALVYDYYVTERKQESFYTIDECQ